MRDLWIDCQITHHLLPSNQAFSTPPPETDLENGNQQEIFQSLLTTEDQTQYQFLVEEEGDPNDEQTLENICMSLLSLFYTGHFTHTGNKLYVNMILKLPN